MDKSSRWLKLDNAGKIFPATSGRRDTGVFRFSCTLTEPVQADVLQRALDKTLLKFPHFLYILRSGLFWYYLEPGDMQPVCHEENTGPCAQLFYRNRRHLLLDVSYYNNRINLEIYHALADGTGVMQFLKYMVCCYLAETHPEAVGAELADDTAPIASSAGTEDSFRKYYRKGKRGISGGPAGGAYRLTGTPAENLFVTEGLMSCGAVLKLAKAQGTTLTVFLCALLLTSIHGEMQLYKEKKPIVITVPVNLRQYFSSDTVRNFFGNIHVSHRFGAGEDSFEAILASLKNAFAEELTEAHLSDIISGFMQLERNPFIRLVPLSLKNLFLKAARRVSDAGETMTLSNVGKIGMPAAVLPYIHHMTVFASTAKLQACICTCGDVLSVAFSSGFEEADIQRNFFRKLTALGVEVEIQSNSGGEEM